MYPHPESHTGPIGLQRTAEAIHEYGKSVEATRQEIQARENAALLELSKQPGYEHVARYIRS